MQEPRPCLPFGRADRKPRRHGYSQKRPAADVITAEKSPGFLMMPRGSVLCLAVDLSQRRYSSLTSRGDAYLVPTAWRRVAETGTRGMTRVWEGAD